MKIAVIINPRAGSIKSFPALLKQISRLAPDRRYTTRKRGNAKLFAARAIREGCNYIIAAGGDGTLNEVVNGIGRSSRIVRLGLLPLGTGNDFARCLGLPSSVDENIEILRAGKTRAIDMIKVTSDRVRYFVNVSAGGFSGIVDENLTSRMKKTWGPLVYLRSAAAAFSDLHSYRTRVRFGSKHSVSHELYNVIVANGRYLAGGWQVAPRANPADGLLDVILIKKAPAATLAFLGAKMMMGKHLKSDAVIFRRVRSVSISSRPRMWFNVDGELVGNQPAKFEVIPRALQFVVGKKK